MRHHRRHQQQQAANGLRPAGGRRGLLGGPGQLVDTRHGLVEAERLDIARHRRDGLVGFAIEGLILAGGGRVILPEQAPQPLHEAPAALDACLAPRQIALWRRIGQHEPADGVGAVFRDDLVRVHHVLLGLGHLDDATDFDRRAIGLQRGAIAIALHITRREPDRLAIGEVLA